MSQEIYNHTVTIPIVSCGTIAAGTFVTPALTMPGTANSGITLKKWWYATNDAIAAGSAPAVRLIELNSTGGKIASGTVCTNGSAATTAGTPVSGSITTYWIPGTVSYLAVEAGQGAYGAATQIFMTVGIQYVIGRGSS